MPVEGGPGSALLPGVFCGKALDMLLTACYNRDNRTPRWGLREEE